MSRAESYVSNTTHVMRPRDVCGRRLGLDVALQVDVFALPDAVGVQRATQAQAGHGTICKKEGRS